MASDWCDFLSEFFDETTSNYIVTHCAADFNQAFGGTATPDLVFVNETLLSKSSIQKLKALKQSSSEFKLFLIASGDSPEENILEADAVLELPDSLAEFRKKLMQFLPLPEVIKVLIVDDEPDIGGALRDYLDHRNSPVFEVEYVENGKKGLEAIQKRMPDVLILDVKMPVMTGIELYAELKRQNLNIPTVVYFDAVSGTEVEKIHKVGRPVIVDKGSEQSSMPEMMMLIKKMSYFG